jgi:hypothetical protein
MTKLRDYLRHAQLYGSDCVYETAATHLAAGELALLRIELDQLERRAVKGRFARKARKRRRSGEETLIAVVTLREQGLVVGAIADKLGISIKVVKELLATHRRRQRAAPEQNLPVPLSAAAGCRRCGWWQDGLETLDAANDALAAYACHAERPEKVSDIDSQGPETAWLSGEITSETQTATDHLEKPFQQQSGSASDDSEAATQTVVASAESPPTPAAVQASPASSRGHKL